MNGTPFRNIEFFAASLGMYNNAWNGIWEHSSLVADR